MTDNIIFYSNNCNYCISVLDKLKTEKITMKYVCIDDDTIKLPPFLNVVPTIYLNTEQKIIIDDEIIQWIENNKETNLQPYCNDAFGQNFEILSSDCPTFSNGYDILEINNVDNVPLSNNSTKKENDFNKKLEQYQKSRNNEFKSIQRI